MKNLITEFRLIKSLHDRNSDVYIASLELYETPEKGEIVNINGDPYVVFSKSWAYSDECMSDYCYITLMEIAPAS